MILMALVVFLRGVNVGGHRRFRPAELAAKLKKFEAVNVGAAGTFVIRKAVNRTDLRLQIARRLPFDTEIMICEEREILRLLSNDKFRTNSMRRDVTRFVSILSRVPRLPVRLPKRFPDAGRWLMKILACDGRFVYGVYRRDFKTIVYLGRMDTIFGATATTRNWNTMQAIANVLVQGRGGKKAPA